MENIASVQDELYYTAKNFNKLKFSNTAYITNTTKDKQENQKEIERLAKEYESLKKEVEELKKKSLYASKRLISATNNQESSINEISLLRRNLDHARALKLKTREEWKKYEEKLKDLKAESKLISDDNNPFVRRIKLLENKLDKAMIKYNEAMSIRRTYEQILARLKEERSGYDNQIAAIQKSLKSKEQDCEEFKLLLQDAKQAKNYSELLLKNTKLSKDAFTNHFEQLINAHQIEVKNEMQNEKLEEIKIKNEKIPILKHASEENINIKNYYNQDLENRLKAYEEADKQIKEVTGADDINEICQKFSNLKETKEKLKKEKKDLEKMKENLAKKKEELSLELNKLKYQGQDEISRKEIEDNERTAERTLRSCEESRTKLKKSEKLIVDTRAGITMIVGILKNKIFEEIFSNESNFNEKEIGYKQSYEDLVTKTYDKDIKMLLTKLIDVSEYLNHKYNISLENYQFYEEDDYNLRSDQEIEHIYLNQAIESNQNSEYVQDEEVVDMDLNNKEQIYKKEFNMMNKRPHSSQIVGKKNSSRYSLKARDKK